MNTANNYCTQADIEDVLSTMGVSLSTDDSPPNALANALDRAGSKIDEYLYRFYEPTQLVLSPTVRDHCAVLAAYYLRTRRGNPPPPGLQVMRDETVAYLKEIAAGRNAIPGIPLRKSYAPVLSKMRATVRPHPRAVVVKSQGTKAGGEPENYTQKLDPWDAAGANVFLDFVI